MVRSGWEYVAYSGGLVACSGDHSNLTKNLEKLTETRGKRLERRELSWDGKKWGSLSLFIG